MHSLGLPNIVSNNAATFVDAAAATTDRVAAIREISAE
jgi:hypothetical protein